MQTGTLADYLGIPTTITGTYGGSVIAARAVDFFNFDDKVPALNSPLVGSPVVSNLSFDSLTSILSSSKSFSDVFITNFANTGSYGYAAPRCMCIPFTVKYETPTQNVVISIPLNRFGLLRQMIFDNTANPIVGFAIYEDENGPKLWSKYLVVSDIEGDVLTLSADLGKSLSSFKLCLIIELRNTVYQKEYMYSLYELGSTTTIRAGLTQDFVSQLYASPISVVYRSDQWTKLEKGNCPFYTPSSKNLPPIPLSALPFRAYESYYNAIVS